MNSPITFTTEQQAILDVLYENYISLFATTASGTNTATINATSGVVTFSSTISADTAPTAFTITNSLITTSTRLRFGLSYSPSGDEMCAIAAYTALNGSVQVWFTNYSTVDATEPKVVDFEILN